jgi:hypothetical protein
MPAACSTLDLAARSVANSVPGFCSCWLRTVAPVAPTPHAELIGNALVKVKRLSAEGQCDPGHVTIVTDTECRAAT